jgi:peroxiredoxin Q/BCP
MAPKTSKSPVGNDGANPEVGDRAPAFTLVDQRGDTVRLTSFKGRRVLVYFYPRAATPGCTTQACGLRDIADQVGDTVVIGISTDPVAKLARFDDKYSLGFTLLSDPDHLVAEKYGVWVEKKLYGKVSMGVARSAFLISATGRIERAWPKISPAETPVALLTALDELS